MTDELVNALACWVQKCVEVLEGKDVFQQEFQWIFKEDLNVYEQKICYRYNWQLTQEIVCKISEWAVVQNLIDQDTDIQRHLSNVIEYGYGFRKLYLHNLSYKFLPEIEVINSQIELKVSVENFNRQIGLLRESVYVDSVIAKTIWPIAGVTFCQDNIELDEQYRIRCLKPHEVIDCLSLGVIKPVGRIRFKPPEGRIFCLERCEALPKSFAEQGEIAMDWYSSGESDRIGQCLSLLGVKNYIPGNLRVVGVYELSGRTGHSVKSWESGALNSLYAFYGKDQDELKILWRYILSIDEDNKSNLSIAVKRFYYSNERSSLEDKIIDLVIALEALYTGSENNELSYRCALNASFWLSLNNIQCKRRHTFDVVRASYKVRSMVVHGNSVSNSVRIGKNHSHLGSLFVDLQTIVRESIRSAFLWSKENKSKNFRPDWEEIVIGTE